MNKPMDYYELMKVAAKNIDKNSATQGKSKNGDEKDKALKAKIESFKKKVEAQKARKAAEDEKKRQNLLALRNQNKKSQSRVNRMLKMTKSANKACMGDARDSFKDSVAEQNEYQPDQDDYGYTSSTAELFHKKFLEKYNPANLTRQKKVETKSYDPVREGNSIRSLNKARREAESPEEPPPETPKGKGTHRQKGKPAPPIISYHDLIALAEEKRKEPVPLPVAPTKKLEEKFEFGRPMTAKEKELYLQEIATKQRIENGTFVVSKPEPKPTPTKSPALAGKRPESKRIPLKAESIKEPKVPVPSTSAKLEEPKPNLMKSPPAFKQPVKRKISENNPHPMKQMKNLEPRREEKPERMRPPQQQQFRNPERTREVPREKPHFNQRPERDSPKPRFQSKRQIIESDDEEEYDSEMDDFIDDSPMEGQMSISDMIRDITGYDKRRFADDSDDDIMETSFAQQQREEHLSLKAGIKEDEEEERKIKEEEARERKKLLMKKKKKNVTINKTR